MRGAKANQARGTGRATGQTGRATGQTGRAANQTGRTTTRSTRGGRKTARTSRMVKEVIEEEPLPPMRCYLVIAHPEPNRRSFCHAIYRKAIETLKLNNHEVMTTDLYDCDFATMPSLADFEDADPTLSYHEHQRRALYREEILRCQSRVEWCTHLILFTPLYWLSPNAALMAWWEKVFGEGWAVAPGQTFDKGCMAGKKAMVVVTCGQDQVMYGKDALNVSVEELMYPLTFRCFAYCGFTPLRTQAFFGVQTADAQMRVDMLNGWAEHVMKLQKRDEIQFSFVGAATKEEKKDSNREKLAELGDMVLITPKDPYAINYD